MAGWKLVTFDVYMALLDIQGGLTSTFAQSCRIAEQAAGAMVSLWRAKQMECAASSNALDMGRTPFRDCTAMALDYVCARHSIQLCAAARHRLVHAWDSLTPWPEADGALAALKAKGYDIAILSNGDQDMLDKVAARFETRFDYVLSSQSAGKYKPHPSIYALPQRKLGIAMADTIHVAGSANDVLGAIAYGMACIWSNKLQDKLVDSRYPPTYEVANLSRLTDVL